MPSWNGAKIIQVLKAKGFQESERDHKFFTLVVNGKKTSISTKVSHSKKFLLSQKNPVFNLIKHQLHMPTNKDLVDFLQCPLTYEKYVDLLIEKKIVKL